DIVTLNGSKSGQARVAAFLQCGVRLDIDPRNGIVYQWIGEGGNRNFWSVREFVDKQEVAHQQGTLHRSGRNTERFKYIRTDNTGSYQCKNNGVSPFLDLGFGSRFLTRHSRNSQCNNVPEYR